MTLLGFYSGSEQNFLVELKPETAKKCADIFRKMQSFCGKDVFSLEVEEFVMRDCPLDRVWEVDADIEFPIKVRDFVEVPQGTLELSPETAKAIASRAREVFIMTASGFRDVSEVRLTRFAFEKVYVFSQYTQTKVYPSGEFFTLPSDEHLIESSYEPTGVWIALDNGAPAVFWEIYDSSNRQNTPYLELEQLDAIANNQPLPQE